MSSFRFISILGVVLIPWVTAASLQAELATSSPFLPKGGSAGSGPAAETPLELRGVMVSGDSVKFSIFDPVKKSGTWVGLNESGYDFAVKKYDAKSDTVTLDYQGRTLSVTLRAAKIASSGIAAAPPPMQTVVGPAMNGPPNPVTRNVVANPTPATEAARLADWQAEIQRRRELRAQQAGAVPAVAAPAAVPAQAVPDQPRGATRTRARQQ